MTFAPRMLPFPFLNCASSLTSCEAWRSGAVCQRSAVDECFGWNSRSCTSYVTDPLEADIDSPRDGVPQFKDLGNPRGLALAHMMMGNRI